MPRNLLNTQLSDGPQGSPTGAAPWVGAQSLGRDNPPGGPGVDGEGLAVKQASSGVSQPIPVLYSGKTAREARNSAAFAALRSDGSVVTWGRRDDGTALSVTGADSGAVASLLRSGVSEIFATGYAFAALKGDGSVVSWGDPGWGGNSTAVASELSSGVTQIFSNAGAFAALKQDGSVVTWGVSDWGGDSESVANFLDFGVTQIYSSGNAFAALKSDGSVVTWGDQFFRWRDLIIDASDRLTSGVIDITPNDQAFAALKSDGSVVTWGSISSGGDSSAVTAKLSSGVAQVFANYRAFAAVKSDGSVVTWGDPKAGADSRSVAEKLTSGVTTIASSSSAFAALKRDGSVVTWGYQVGNASAVASKLASGVSKIVGTDYAFAALKLDGSVVTWGEFDYGGNSRSVASQLASGVVQLQATGSAFAALKADGSVVTWGDPNSGGDSRAVAAQLSSGVVQLVATDGQVGQGGSFAALKRDGSVVTWGDPDTGGDSSAVADQLTDVVGFANPFSADRLIPEAPLPSISLAVAPQSVAEDGSASLRYTFSRTGPTDSSLVVSFTIGGTATLGSDYTGIASARRSKTVVIPAGAAASTLSLQPSSDINIESDETIAITLAAGRGYTINTTASVTASLRNDDVGSTGSRTLRGEQSSLHLQGSKRINGVGNARDNTIIGNANNNRLYGLQGADILIGGGAKDSDVFAYTSLSESLIYGGKKSTTINHDTIQDFNSRDRILAPLAVETTRLTTIVGSASALTPTAIAQLLTPNTFAANAVAAFSSRGPSGSFIAMNDARAGFQPDSDAILFLADYRISTTNFVEFV
ncbi:MAG: bluetail domain-containing putative surface protein [Cyanobacteriota bacterium]|nr:bluetail domain-containing putative surface protein [Cyanobacteriota bacterium]